MKLLFRFMCPPLPRKEEWTPEDTANVRDLMGLPQWKSMQKFLRNRQAEHNADLVISGQTFLVERMDECRQIETGLNNFIKDRPKADDV